jgi:hypothetical protein
MADKPTANNSPAPAQSAASSVLLCSPEGVATPDRVCRVAMSLGSIASIVDDRRKEWADFLETDFGKFGNDQKQLISELFKLFPAE